MKRTDLQSMSRMGSGRNQNRLVAIMAIVIVALAAVVVYSTALRPAFNGYVVERQNEAQYMVVNALLSQLQQNGYIQIPLDEENVLTLVEYKQPQQQEAVPLEPSQ